MKKRAAAQSSPSRASRTTIHHILAESIFISALKNVQDSLDQIPCRTPVDATEDGGDSPSDTRVLPPLTKLQLEGSFLNNIGYLVEQLMILGESAAFHYKHASDGMGKEIKRLEADIKTSMQRFKARKASITSPEGYIGESLYLRGGGHPEYRLVLSEDAVKVTEQVKHFLSAQAADMQRIALSITRDVLEGDSSQQLDAILKSISTDMPSDDDSKHLDSFDGKGLTLESARSLEEQISARYENHLSSSLKRLRDQDDAVLSNLKSLFGLAKAVIAVRAWICCKEPSINWVRNAAINNSQDALTRAKNFIKGQAQVLGGQTLNGLEGLCYSDPMAFKGAILDHMYDEDNDQYPVASLVDGVGDAQMVDTLIVLLEIDALTFISPDESMEGCMNIDMLRQLQDQFKKGTVGIIDKWRLNGVKTLLKKNGADRQYPLVVCNRSRYMLHTSGALSTAMALDKKYGMWVERDGYLPENALTNVLLRWSAIDKTKTRMRVPYGVDPKGHVEQQKERPSCSPAEERYEKALERMEMEDRKIRLESVGLTFTRISQTDQSPIK